MKHINIRHTTYLITKQNTRFFVFIMFLILAISHLNGQERIPMTIEQSGIYTVPCEVNGLKLKFIFDTGAADVHLSLVEAAFMLKNGYISSDDFIGKGKYSMADGSISENSMVNLKEIKIGNVVINNVTACISSNTKASLLLGQSAIQKLGPYSINGNYLILDSHGTKSLNGFKTINENNGNVYTGFVTNGVYEGQGKMIYANGRTYEGNWKFGKRNGYGILRYKSGNIEYEGEWKEDKRHGQGTSYGIIGNKYVGNFANDSKFGKGVSYTSSGDSTVAVWRSGYYDCTGTKYYKNGETLTGTWVGGYKEGKFIHTYPNGRKSQEFYQKDSLISIKTQSFSNSTNYNDAELYEHFTGKGKKDYKDGTYNGEFVNGKRQGFGVMTYIDGSTYEGNWNYDNFDGKGTFKWKSGGKYVGDFKNGWRHGAGVYTWPNGDEYVGQFEKGKRSGKGKITYKSGGAYDGEWRESKWNGHGAVVYDNGDEYTGNFLEGKKHGDGIMYYSTGDKYDGKWANNLFEGIGTYSWKNGDKYVGSFREGLMSGYGTYTWSSGDRYEGYWANNKRNGSGTYYYVEGGTKMGIWKDGKYQEKTSTNGSITSYSNVLSSSATNNTTTPYKTEIYDDAYAYKKYVPKSYYTAHTVTAVNLREGPGKDYGVITTISEGESIFMETSERYKDFAKVLHIKTGEEGYVSSAFLDGYTKIKVNEKGALEVTGKTYNKYADIILKNDTKVTTKITIGDKTYMVSPNSSKRIKNIEGGTYNIMASSPGIIPYVGVDTVEGGYEYSWKFYIQTVKK